MPKSRKGLEQEIRKSTQHDDKPYHSQTTKKLNNNGALNKDVAGSCPMAINSP